MKKLNQFWFTAPVILLMIVTVFSNTKGYDIEHKYYDMVTKVSTASNAEAKELHEEWYRELSKLSTEQLWSIANKVDDELQVLLEDETYNDTKKFDLLIQIEEEIARRVNKQ